MVILFLLFLIQFSLAIALLAMTKENQQQLIVAGWGTVSDKTRNDAMKNFECCDLHDWHPNDNITCPVGLRGARIFISVIPFYEIFYLLEVNLAIYWDFLWSNL